MPESSSTTRVLFLAPHPYFRLRGVCIAEQTCLEALSRRGVRVDVLAFPFGADPEPLPDVRLLRLPALPFVRDVPIGPSWRKLAMDLWSLPFITVLLLKTPYDVVHACEESAFLAALLKPLFRFRLVYDMDDVLSLRLKRGGFLRSRRPLRAVAALERWMIRSADVVVTNSRETTRFARRYRPFERVVFYDHAPKLPRAAVRERESVRREWGLGEREVILYAGNLEAYQGVELLVDSLPAVFKSLPSACCVVIGGREDQIDALRRRCQALGIGSSVRWLGPRPIPEAFRFMQAADALVAPMTQKKAVPMKLYAYASAGRPIVATGLPNNRELLDEDSAVLVAPEAGSLADGLLKALREGVAASGGGGDKRRRALSRAAESAAIGMARAYALVRG